MTELFFHIDFRQNYECKYAAEPHSVHFGASRESVFILKTTIKLFVHFLLI